MDNYLPFNYFNAVRSIRSLVFLLLKKNLLRNSIPDSFIIRGGFAQRKSQALYDI